MNTVGGNDNSANTLLSLLKDDKIQIDAATSAEIERIMKKRIKESFVKQHHHRAINYLEARGRWKTKVGNPRKDVERKDYDDLIDYLFEYYNKDHTFVYCEMTVQAAFELFLERKADRGRDQSTVERNRYLYNKFTDPIFRSKAVTDIDQDMFVKMLNRQLKQYEKSKGTKVKIREIKDYVKLGGSGYRISRKSFDEWLDKQSC